MTTRRRPKALPGSAAPDGSRWRSRYDIAILTQIARAQGLQRRFADAQATLDQVRMRPDSNDTGSARSAISSNKAESITHRGVMRKRCGWFQDAFTAANAQQQDFYGIDALHMLAIADVPERQCIGIYKQWHSLNNPPIPARRTGKDRCTTTLGGSYFEEGEYSQALTSFEPPYNGASSRAKSVRYLIARWCVARTLRALGQP